MLIFIIRNYNNQPATLHHKDKFVFVIHTIPNALSVFTMDTNNSFTYKPISSASQSLSYRPMMIWYQPIISTSKWELLLPDHIIHNLYTLYKDKQL